MAIEELPPETVSKAVMLLRGRLSGQMKSEIKMEIARGNKNWMHRGLMIGCRQYLNGQGMSEMDLPIKDWSRYLQEILERVVA